MSVKLRNLLGFTHALHWVLLQIRRHLASENIFYWLRCKQEVLIFGFWLCSAKMVYENSTGEVALKQN